MIQSVLFDMGKVLVDFSHDRMCSQVAAVSGQPVDRIRQLLIHEGLQWSLELGQIDETEFAQRFNDRMNASVETPELLHALSDIFTPVSGMEDLVARLASTDLRLILLSNTCRAHLEHIRSHFHVLSYFDAVTVSYEVGAMKPDEAIYLDAIAKAGCRPDECFYLSLIHI